MVIGEYKQRISGLGHKHKTGGHLLQIKCCITRAEFMWGHGGICLTRGLFKGQMGGIYPLVRFLPPLKT